MSDQRDEPTKILGDSDKETLTDRILRWAKNNAIIAILIVAVLTIGGIAGLSDSIQKLLLATHVIKSEALVLAEDSAKSDFSRRLTRNAWRRLFWARQYVERNRLGLPLPDQDIAWQKYYDATEDWNSELMIYIQALQAYYPNSGKRDVFENDIQVQFASAFCSPRLMVNLPSIAHWFDSSTQASPFNCQANPFRRVSSSLRPCCQLRL